jgi:4-diphosphocytidyl-2-C-methyl-D-erythritol kinase
MVDPRKAIPAAGWVVAPATLPRLNGYLCLTKRKCALEQLSEIGAALGADVPFFLAGGRALGVSKGDEIYPIPDIPRLHLLVVSPKSVQVPTPDAYRWLKAPQLINSPENLRLLRFCALSWSLQGGPLRNNFEEVVFRRHPVWLKSSGSASKRSNRSLAGGSGSRCLSFPEPS